MRHPALLLALLLFASPLAAQTVTGRLVDRDDGTPVAGAVLHLFRDDSVVLARTRTDSAGVFVLRAPRPGEYSLLAHGAARHDPAEFGPIVLGAEGMRVRLEIAATAITLTPVVVEAMERLERTAYGGFYERQRTGSPGRYFDREALERASPVHLADILRRVPALEVRLGMGPRFEVRLRHPLSVLSACPTMFYVDGIRVDAEIAASIDPRDLEGIEVHTHGAPPAELASVAGASCGIVALWTRRSERRTGG